MAAPKKVDYERIEPGWRAGVLSPHQLAAQYTEDTGVKVSHAAIIKHFTKLNVPRDLNAKIQAQADAMVTKALVTEKVTKDRLVTNEGKIVSAGAEQVFEIRLFHRKSTTRLQTIIAAQMEELEASSGPEQAQRLRDLGELMRNENDKGSDKLNDIYLAVIGLPDRSRVAKQLAETLRIAIDLERREFGMDKTQVNTDPLTELIKRISTSNGSAFTPVAVDPAYSGGDE